MSTPAPRPCGSWPSPITSELIVAETVGLGQLAGDGDDLLWVEGRPREGGRSVLVRHRDGLVADVAGAPFDVRTRVHEYGGQAHAVSGGVVWFSDLVSGRLHRLDPGGHPRPITPEGDLRYADLDIDAGRGRLLAVLEDHTTGAREPVNAIAAIPLEGGSPETLAGGHDFAAAPRLSPDGRLLAWLTWDHPRMPWDGTDLWVATLDAAGRAGDPAHVAGGPRESVLDPAWAPDGSLWFASDGPTGWWNLHRWEPGGTARSVTRERMEFGGPPWLLGMRGHAVLDGGTVVAVAHAEGRGRLVTVDPASGTVREVRTPYTSWARRIVPRGARRVAAIAASAREPWSVIDIDIDTGAVDVLRRGSAVSVDPDFISIPQAVAFPSAGGRTAHALHYAPRNPACTVPAGERPPVRVLSHGGPTSSASSALDLEIQYFTSRGFAVVDVDYGGSTGYGRAYREVLYGEWGIVDVEDCVAAVRHLAEGGLADARRAVIAGGSAGGYTTLRALTTTDAFAAGCSLYGVGDLTALARDTHKFESRYLDQLVGPYPECAAVYEERSPVNHTDALRSPVILFQGLDDRVVPPAQSEAFFAAARARGLACAYVTFEGEQHGFRIAANIRRCLDGELYFYSRVLGFPLADPVDPVPIVNLAR